MTGVHWHYLEHIKHVGGEGFYLIFAFPELGKYYLYKEANAVQCLQNWTPIGKYFLMGSNRIGAQNEADADLQTLDEVLDSKRIVDIFKPHDFCCAADVIENGDNMAVR